MTINVVRCNKLPKPPPLSITSPAKMDALLAEVTQLRQEVAPSALPTNSLASFQSHHSSCAH